MILGISKREVTKLTETKSLFELRMDAVCWKCGSLCGRLNEMYSDNKLYSSDGRIFEIIYLRSKEKMLCCVCIDVIHMACKYCKKRWED